MKLKIFQLCLSYDMKVVNQCVDKNHVKYMNCRNKASLLVVVILFLPVSGNT